MGGGYGLDDGVGGKGERREARKRARGVGGSGRRCVALRKGMNLPSCPPSPPPSLSCRPARADGSQTARSPSLRAPARAGAQVRGYARERWCAGACALRVRAPHPSHAAPPAAAPAAHRSLRVRAECRVGGGGGGKSGQGQGQGRGGGRKRGTGREVCGCGEVPTCSHTHAHAHARERTADARQGQAAAECGTPRRRQRGRAGPALRPASVSLSLWRGGAEPGIVGLRPHRRPSPLPRHSPTPSLGGGCARRCLRAWHRLWPVLRPACGIPCPCREELLQAYSHDVQRVLDWVL
jgi:hypothetical protein